MLRWAFISVVSAAAFLSIELLVLNSVLGKDKDKDNKGSSRVRNESGGGGGGGSKSFSSRDVQSRSIEPRTVQPRNIESRSVQPREVQPRSVQPRNIEPRVAQPRNLDTKKFSAKDLPSRIQTQPRTRVETLRPPTGDTGSRLVKPKDDAPRFNPPNRGNDAAAEAIRNAQQKIGSRRIESTKPLDAQKFDKPKFDKPNFETPNIDSPRFTQPNNGRRDALDRIKRPDGNNIGDNKSKFDQLPKSARDALDRANINRDLKLGDGNKGGPNIGGRGPDDRKSPDFKQFPGKFDANKYEANKVGTDRFRDDGNRGPSNLDRKRDLENKLGIDKSNRERYDLLHHRIKYDGRLDNNVQAKLAKQSWIEKGDRKHYDRLASSPQFNKYRLNDQYRLHDRGDVARRLDIYDDFNRRGGWQHRNVGFVSPSYRNHCAYRNYYGPSWYPRRCWYPVWNNWVSWSWSFNCQPWFDPRPVYCRPVVYDPCPQWVAWQYPVWQPLPVVAAGTWVDVPQVVVNQGWDVRLLAVRFVDPGHFEQNLGQRYRAWIRNDSPTDIDRPFDVVLMGVDGLIPDDRRLEIGQRIPGLKAGQTLAVDLRLPLTPNGQAGQPVDYSNVHVLVDANRELNDVEQTNNGAVIERGDIMPVDPAAFNADSDVVEPGMVINIAGEGLGPEPGQVMLQVDGETYQPEILGWYDLGVQVRVPVIAAVGAASGDLVIVRGDGAAANPLTLQIAEADGGRSF